MLRRNRVLLFAVAILICLLASHPRIAASQEFSSPTCLSDTLSALDLDVLLHEFGSDLITYPNEFVLSSTFPAFAQVFELYVSDTVSDRWSESEWEDLIGAVMSNDTTDTDDDIFGVVWEYFCRDDADENPSHAYVDFSSYGVGSFNKVRIRLYSTADLDNPCTFEDELCKGYSFQFDNTITINASSSNSMEVVLGLGIAHELQHVCFAANGTGGVLPYKSINETLSTLAEYFVGAWRPHDFDISYDASILRDEPCDMNSKYDVEKMWITYLYEVFKGDGGDPTDDLIYRFIRNDESWRMRFYGLAATLWDNDFDWVGGTDLEDRFNKVMANFLAAKFCNAPSFGANARFGMGSLNTVEDFGLFVDNCDSVDPGDTPMFPRDCPHNVDGYPGAHRGCWNVRMLPPSYELDDSHENSFSAVADYYTNGDDTPAIAEADTSHDTIDVTVMGTDYIVFRAGEYFADAEEHELQVNIQGAARQDNGSLVQMRVRPMGWVIGYCCENEYPQQHPEDIVFIEPIRFDPPMVTTATSSASVTVTEFGRSINTVVIAMTLAPDSLSHALNPWTNATNYFTYEYAYGVLTPGASSRAWTGDVFVLGDVTVADGGSLEIEAGTYVKVFNDDLAATGADAARIEFNIDGELIVSGTEADPVTIHPWTQTTSEDWAGIYFSSDSEGGTFTYCTIGYAEFVIDSYAPIEIDDSTIRGASDALVSIWNSTLDIDDSVIRLSNGDAIRLDDADATIDDTLVEDCVGYGLYMSGNGALNITQSQFLDSNVGVYVENNTTNGTIAESSFDCVTGLSYYNSTKPSIDECVITGNTTGIRLDHYSSPSILHCINSTTYDGDITGNGSGIYCTDNSDPTIGHCNISSSSTGVGVFNNSEPDLDGYGANRFASNSAYHVANLVTGTTVPATENYWSPNTGSPNYYPNPARISGSVDYTSALSAGPNPSSPRPGDLPEREVVVTGLGRAHPNPFNPVVQIPYGVANASDVRLDIFDVSGRLVRTLVDGRKERGNHVVVWDGTTSGGSPTASAVFFVRMRAGRVTETQKIVLLK